VAHFVQQGTNLDEVLPENIYLVKDLLNKISSTCQIWPDPHAKVVRRIEINLF